MTLHELLLQRHSIRRYTDKQIDAEDVKTILEAALLAPTSKNSRSWDFVVVDKPDVLRKLEHLKPTYATGLSTAPLAVVVTASPEKSEAFIEDATCAAMFMHLQAADLGLGSCWIQVRGRDTADGEPSENYVREMLGIPNEMVVECIMTFGYADETRRPVDPEKLKWEKVHIGNWTNSDVD